MTLRYFCDLARHLVCVPYSIANLHRMARDLDLHRCWFHNGAHPHYDIPKRRVQEIQDRCTLVPTRTILGIIRCGRGPRSRSGVNRGSRTIR